MMFGYKVGLRYHLNSNIFTATLWTIHIIPLFPLFLYHHIYTIPSRTIPKLPELTSTFYRMFPAPHLFI